MDKTKIALNNLNNNKYTKQARSEMYGKSIGAYQTFSLMDDQERQDETNIAIPDDLDVEEARFWSEENKK